MGGSSGGDGGGDVPWPFDYRPVPFPLSNAPMSLKDLIGRKCRVVRRGEAVTQEIEPGRVTVLLSDSGRVEEIYCDPDLPSK